MFGRDLNGWRAAWDQLPAGRVDVAVDRRNVATGRRRYRVRVFVFERTVERGLSSAPQVVDALISMWLIPMVPLVVFPSCA